MHVLFVDYVQGGVIRFEENDDMKDGKSKTGYGYRHFDANIAASVRENQKTLICHQFNKKNKMLISCVLS